MHVKRLTRPLFALLLALGCALPLSEATAAPPQSGWVTYKADHYGFSMLVPKGTKITEKSSTQGWACLSGEYQGVKAFGYAELGIHHSRKSIESFGVKVTKIPAKHWTEIDKGKTRGRWTWYRTVKAALGNVVYVGTYGIGPRGSYMLLLKTTQSDYAEDPAAYKKWYESLKLHGGWKIYQTRKYGFSMLVPEKGTTIKDTERGRWGMLTAKTKGGVQFIGVGRRGKPATWREIEAFGIKVTRIPGDSWKQVHKGKNRRGWTAFRTVIAKKDGVLTVGIYGHSKKGSFMLLVLTTPQDYKRHKKTYDRWYESVFLDL